MLLFRPFNVCKVDDLWYLRMKLNFKEGFKIEKHRD